MTLKRIPFTNCQRCKELHELIEQLEDWHFNGRANIAKTGAGVKVCWGGHEKDADCEWVYFVLNEYQTP